MLGPLKGGVGPPRVSSPCSPWFGSLGLEHGAGTRYRSRRRVLPVKALVIETPPSKIPTRV